MEATAVAGWPATASAVSPGVSGVEDQFEYLGRPGGERGMAGVELDGFAGVDALSHPPLGLRWDHPILGRDLVPTWLGLPRRCSGGNVETPPRGWTLGYCHNQRLGVVVEVLAEAVVEGVLRVPHEAL